MSKEGLIHNSVLLISLAIILSRQSVPLVLTLTNRGYEGLFTGWDEELDKCQRTIKWVILERR